MRANRPPLAWLLGLPLLLSACSEPARPPAVRHYTFRAIGGFSMGSATAALLGLKHRQLWDIIAPMGGPINMAYYMRVLKEEVFAGFCEPPEVGRMCPAPDALQHYEHLDCGGPASGLTRRTSAFEAYKDAVIAMGNFMAYNPLHPYLPAGVPFEYLLRSRHEMCANPVRLPGFYDWRYNPEGLHPAITYCESRSPVDADCDFYPELPADFPMEIALAIDLNDNGRRDSGEPVLFWTSERFEDVGADGLPSSEEPGHDPVENPDPAGDDYHPWLNALGTEGNHRWDAGEPFLDFGLDGVPDTAGSPYDYGEGNGVFDYNPNVLRMAAEADPARILTDMPAADLARLDFYMDAGIRDHLRFQHATEAFAGILRARGREIDRRSRFESLLPAGYPPGEPYVAEAVDWSRLGRDVYLVYGKADASDYEILRGDGGHVGNGAEMLHRFTTSAAYVASRWPDGDRRKLPPEASPWRVLDETYPSQILGEDKQYYVFLPPGYDDDERRYPVLYLIHGIGMSADIMTVSAAFVDVPMRQGQMQKFIMVFPDAECRDGDCFDGNFLANQRGREKPPRRFEDSFVQELIPHIDATYRTRPPEDVEVAPADLAPLVR
jgi:hypothetical protein